MESSVPIRVSPRSPKTRVLRHAEHVLLIGGILLLVIYAAALGYGRFSQAYYGWAFDRVLRGQPAPLLAFVSETLFRHEGPDVAATAAPDLAHPAHQAYTPGALIGRLEIPGLNLSVMVVEGTGRKALSEGVGHIEGTPLPGQPGNLGIAGHRDSFFRGLQDISADDVITLTTFAGKYRYRVEKTAIVRPSDTSVLDNTPNRSLTLVTCYPFYYIGNAPKRFVVKAQLLDRENH